jgi:hypothetical protein
MRHPVILDKRGGNPALTGRGYGSGSVGSMDAMIRLGGDSGKTLKEQD